MIETKLRRIYLGAIEKKNEIHQLWILGPIVTNNSVTVYNFFIFTCTTRQVVLLKFSGVG
jgi:hypothetical protein